MEYQEQWFDTVSVSKLLKVHDSAVHRYIHKRQLQAEVVLGPGHREERYAISKNFLVEFFVGHGLSVIGQAEIDSCSSFEEQLDRDRESLPLVLDNLLEGRDELLTLEEAANVVGTVAKTVHNWITSGGLAALCLPDGLAASWRPGRNTNYRHRVLYSSIEPFITWQG